GSAGGSEGSTPGSGPAGARAVPAGHSPCSFAAIQFTGVVRQPGRRGGASPPAPLTWRRNGKELDSVLSDVRFSGRRSPGGPSDRVAGRQDLTRRLPECSFGW